MLSVEDALARVLGGVARLELELVPLSDAVGRALAEDLVAPHALPPFANSAMDGYALLAADTSAASPALPARLKVVGEVAAGRSADLRVVAGSAVRIMTGAPIPPGADAVVMVEATATDGPWVLVREPVTAGQHVRAAGEDVRAGEVVMGAGDELGPAHVGMLASLGMPTVPVVRRPRVALITTGDEVVDAAQPLRPGQIRNANRYSLAAQVAAAGADVAFFRHVRDDLDETRAALVEAAAGADALICTGGVSVGEYDYLRAAMESHGSMSFWRVAMKPGKPLAFGRVADRPCFGLPGNPVSAMVTFELFVRPALRLMGGHKVLQRPTVRAKLASPVAHEPGRREYLRARTVWTPDGMVAHPAAGQGSAMLKAMLSANSLAVVPEGVASLPAGASVDVLILTEAGLSNSEPTGADEERE